MITISSAKALVHRFHSIYTMSVNARKLINTLLVVLLCYSQMAASMHMAGHAFESNNGTLSEQASHNCDQPENHSHPAASLKEPLNNDKHDNGRHAALADCEIYHTYSALSGLFDTATPTQNTNSSLNLQSAYTPLQLKHTAFNSHPIRAPPAFS